MIDALRARYRSWLKYRTAYGELMQLTDRELDELGIGRRDIPTIARRASR